MSSGALFFRVILNSDTKNAYIVCLLCIKFPFQVYKTIE